MLGAGAEIIPCRLVGRGPDDHHAVGLPAGHIMAEEFLRSRLERYQRLVPSLRCGGTGTAQQAVVERIDCRRPLPFAADYHDGDRSGFPAPQTGSARVDMISQLLGCQFDTAAGRFGDRLAARQGTADGRLADPGPLGNID